MYTCMHVHIRNEKNVHLGSKSPKKYWGLSPCGGKLEKNGKWKHLKRQEVASCYVHWDIISKRLSVSNDKEELGGKASLGHQWGNISFWPPKKKQ